LFNDTSPTVGGTQCYILLWLRLKNTKLLLSA